MNLPNRLTVLRMALVPVFLVFLLGGNIRYNFVWALLVFAAASLTDMLDGQIARKRGLVTDFGKFMDPLADKILVMAAMVCFVELKFAPAVAVVVILAREFLVTSLRLIAAGKGTVIAADKWGKIKTVVQMVWVLVVLAGEAAMDIASSTVFIGAGEPPLYLAVFRSADLLLSARGLFMWLSVALTVISGVNYVWKNRACISQM